MKKQRVYSCYGVISKKTTISFEDGDQDVLVLPGDHVLITVHAAEQTGEADSALVVRDLSGVVTCKTCGTGLGYDALVR